MLVQDDKKPLLEAIIPAQAGIHNAASCNNVRWIPAYAGMTKYFSRFD
jgi:hypothetical protein